MNVCDFRSVKVGDRVAVHNWIGSKYGTYGQYTVCLPYSVVKIPDGSFDNTLPHNYEPRSRSR